MQEEERLIDVGDENEVEQEIDLEAPAPEQSLEEEIHVEKVEDNNQPADTSQESNEQPAVQDSKSKDELGEYSESVQKRIAKLTRKMREAERQKEEAIAYAQQIKTQADRVQGQYDKLGNNYAKELEQKVTAGMAAAKAELKAATEAQDIDRQVEAQKAIAQMAMEETRLGQVKAYQEKQLERAKTDTSQVLPQETQQPVPTTQDLYQAAQQIDPKAQDWSAKNPWFGTDNAMTYTAFDIHRQLVEEEGYDPQSDNYYSEVDKRIRLEFPHKFGNNESTTAEPVQTVASAKRPAAKGRRKTVKLTPSQIAISRRLGVPLEEYAKQLAAKEV